MNEKQRAAYEAAKKAWVAKQLAKDTEPLTEHQKFVIRTMFAGHRADMERAKGQAS